MNLIDLQIDTRPRRERRPEIVRLAKQKRKLERRLRKVNLQVVFDNESVTAFGNFHAIETFKQAIGLSSIIKDNFSLSKGANSIYKAEDVLESLIDCCCLGLSRFEHMEALRYDPGYKELKGIPVFPSEKVLRDFFKQFGLKAERCIGELIKINLRLVELKAQWEGPREVTIDFDDTVLTLFGYQEGGEVGYNPRYHGRPSFKVKVAFIDGTSELLWLNLYGGKTHSNGGFLEFFKTTESMLPHNYVLKRVRLDKGFFDQENFDYFEGCYLEYVCKAPLKENLRKAIELIAEEEWEGDGDVSLTSRDFILPAWRKPRRFVIRRMKIDRESGQLTLPSCEFYRYEAVVTNMEESPQEVMDFYDGRATCENKIDEIKDGFAVQEASQHEKVRNYAFMLVKAIAYNLMNWFRQAILPPDKSKWEIKTIRRVIINVPGNILGSGRYHRIRLAANKALAFLIEAVKRNLDSFLYFVVNHFQPLRT
jgi:hypothetical protein